MNLILDTVALIAVDRKDRLVGPALRLTERDGRTVVTSAAVVARAWRHGARQANLARLLAGARVEAARRRRRP